MFQGRFKADQLLEEEGARNTEGLSPSETRKLIRDLGVKCPECGGRLGEPTYFTTMFKTVIGPYAGNEGFFRPETAQGMFVEFKRVHLVLREMLPLGIAQIGRGFRNEISPRQGPIRLREFDMMELELFYDPKKPKCPFLDEVKDTEINILPEREVLRGGEVIKVTISEALSRKYILSDWLAYFMGLAQEFISKLGVPADKQRFREKLPGERAHYSRQTFDQEVLLSKWGWVEVSGHADRFNYDLSSHMKVSKQDLTAKRELKKPVIVEGREVKLRLEDLKNAFKKNFKRLMRLLSKKSSEELIEELNEKGYVEINGVKINSKFFDVIVKRKKVRFERFTPYVAEPSFGLDRACYATLEYAYRRREGRNILSLPPYIAPIETAVFPIVSKDKFIKPAEDLRDDLREAGFKVIFEFKESIGKRYARVDEIGVPVAFTVDGQTLIDNTVTARDRDTWRQIRIKKNRCVELVNSLIKTGSFNKALEKLQI